MAVPPGAPEQGGEQQPGQGGQTGQQGEMLDGQQVDPAMPEGSTVSMENAQNVPQEGIPSEMQSPLSAQTQGGGLNLLALARRAATQLLKMEDGPRMAEMNRMKMLNPQLFSLVFQLVNKEQGSQADPLDPVQSPTPQVKPSRRKASVGV